MRRAWSSRCGPSFAGDGKQKTRAPRMKLDADPLRVRVRVPVRTQTSWLCAFRTPTESVRMDRARGELGSARCVNGM